MSQPTAITQESWPARLRERFGRRAAGIALALAFEALLVLALLTLSPTPTRIEDSSMATFDVAPEPEAPPSVEPADEAPAEPEPADAAPAEPAPPPPLPEIARVAPPPVITSPPPPAFIELSREDMAAADIARPSAPAPAAAPRAPYGPAAPSDMASGDTERVGTAPNGEPLYAAAWYREPYESELRGYLSTARGPGWATIACRTVADYRVEDCVAVGEGPEGSNIARSVLAAAWQFKVRPPRRGGRSMVGTWVRIRIDYEQRRR